MQTVGLQCPESLVRVPYRAAMAQEDPGSLAETFSAGVQYIRGVFGGAEDERLAKLEAKLDLSKITERVYAMGAPQTKKPTDPKKNRNNGAYLQRRSSPLMIPVLPLIVSLTRAPSPHAMTC